MNIKISLFLVSIASFSACLNKVQSQHICSVKESIKNGNYDNCRYYLDRTSLTSEAKSELLELAERKCQEKKLELANRSHGLVRFIKFLMCGGVAAGSTTVATVSGAMLAGSRYVSRSGLQKLEQFAIPGFLVGSLISILSLKGMHTAVFGVQNLEKNCITAEAVKKLIEAKKISN